MKGKVSLLICCLLSLGNFILHAESKISVCNPIVLSSDNKSFTISQLVYYFEDPGCRLTFEDVSKPEFSDKFLPSSSSKMNFGFTHSAYWVKFCIRNKKPEQDDWLFEIEYVHFDSIEFYHIDGDNRLTVKKLGDRYPFRQRELYYKTFVIPLHQTDTLQHTYYVRFRTEGSMQLSMNIYSEKVFFKKAIKTETYYGIFFGIMLALFLYNLSVYFSLRDISYLHCVILILTNTIFQGVLSGHIFQYLLGNSMWLNNNLIPISIFFAEFCMILFAKSFLNTKRYSAGLNLVLNYALYLALISMFAVFIVGYNISAQIATRISLLYILLCLLSGVICLFKGNRAARIYILAFTLYLMGAVAMSLMTVGLLPRNLLTTHGMEIGSMLMWIFLSLALTNNYKLSINEKNKAQEEINQMRQREQESLERKVKERTIEIEEKNEKLKQQKEELQTTLDYLRKTQAQLIESEKLSALGGLVAGVAHEINTPVGIGVTAASNLQEEIEKMAALFEQDKISRKDFKEFLEYSVDSVNLILKNLERTAELVQSFKQVSADQLSEQQRVFNFRSYLDDIIRSLYPKFKPKEVEFEIVCDENLELNSYPGAYAQIFTNLLLNSFIHGFDEKKSGKISIHISAGVHMLKIEYRDDGKGISKTDLPHIFEPFFTSEKHQGTGLGLNIVYNLVKQKLKGTVFCESEPGRGVLFLIEIPNQEHIL